MNPDGELEVAYVVIDVNSTLRGTEEDSSAVRRPLNKLEADFELFAPEASAFDGSDNDGAIFVDNSNFFTIWRPSHVCDHTFVTVVDHFLKPM